MFPAGIHHDRYASALILILGLVLVLAAGAGLLGIIGNKSVPRRLHGMYVFRWMVAGWIIGSGVGVYMVGNPGCFVGEADVGFAGAGLLAGWFIGMVHGGVVLWRRRRRNA